MTDTAVQRAGLGTVHWIGGGSGAGKSTIARRIAAQHGLQLYSTDDVMADHARRAPPEDAPALQRFLAMDMDERWVERSPEAMLDTFHWFRGEGFELIVDDLLQLPADIGVVAEGFRLLPARVAPLLTDRRHAVWLLPSPDFREAAFDQRGTTWDIPSRTRDPHGARRNLLARDDLFTDRLRAETSRLGLSVIDVHLGMTETEVADLVATQFGL